MAAPSDAELMTAVQEDDLSQLGVLFERHHLGLFNFFLRLTGNRSWSEDLVQEVFVRILKYRKSFRPALEFRPWLYAMARNAAAAHFKKHRRDAAPDSEPEQRLCDRPLALERLEDAEAARLLRSSLLRMPHEKREVLLLSRFGEMRYDQIAGLLGCSVGAVKLRVHRAVKQLREIYSEMALGRPQADSAPGAPTP